MCRFRNSIRKILIWQRVSIYLLEIGFRISKLKSPATMTSLIVVLKARPIEETVGNIETDEELGGL